MIRDYTCGLDSHRNLIDLDIFDSDGFVMYKWILEELWQFRPRLEVLHSLRLLEFGCVLQVFF